MPKKDKNKYITLQDLGEFTEEIIFPGVERIVEDKLEKVEIKLEEKMEEKFASFKEVMVEEIGQTIMESNDKLATKIDNLSKELAAHGASHHRIDIQLDDHDKRIKKLEVVKSS